MKVKQYISKTKKFLKQLLNWRFAVCFILAWMITNGWSYVFVAVGRILDIKWMFAVGSAYVAFLWLPCTPEKLITIPIAIFLQKLLFKKHTQTSEELSQMLSAEKSIDNSRV